MLEVDSKKACFPEGPHRPVLRDHREARFRSWGLGVKLGPGRARLERQSSSPATTGPQVLLHRATESPLLPLPGALDPSRGPLGRGQEAPPGPPPLCTGLPVGVLPRHELPGGWSAL